MTDSREARRSRTENTGSAEFIAVEGNREGPKKAYASPRLECFGRLSEITQFGGSRMLDSGNNLQSPSP